ncbi:type 4a pilus biogenesis protein PilO [Candidatus Sumerlaeota bacterium]|nr:type 4a pilus biogenesis protein PilO [Candidatus Sumerlaeota bacterium]
MELDEQAKKNLTVGLFIAIMLTAGFGYYHYIWLKPYYQSCEEKIKSLKSEIKVLNGELREIEAVEKQKDQIAEMQRVVDEATKRLPNTPDAAGFYQELIRVLRITGVFATRVEPGRKRTEAMYTEIPYIIACQCRYHEYGQFLNLIEDNQSRFMRVNSFNIKNNDNRPSIHPISVNISTFMFNK